MKQGTEEWYIARLGHITGSRFEDVIALDKTGKRFLKSRETAIAEITLELITGSPGATWTSKATEWGKYHEPFARAAYEIETGNLCNTIGFVQHKKHLQVGCSPDGIISNRLGWEAKCPYTVTVHLDTLLNGMPKEHMAQVQGGMWCCDLDEWDFISYHPFFPTQMRLYIQTIKRDQKFIDDMEEKVLSAIKEINDTVDKLISKYKILQ